MKKGQATIFIILGIVLVTFVLLFFALRGDLKVSEWISPTEVDLYNHFSVCVQKSLQQKVDLIASQGGYVANKLNLSFEFTNESEVDISYLCYQQNNYLPCVNQQPMLIAHLKKELEREIEPVVVECFDSLVNSFKKTSDSVTDKYEGFELGLYPDRVVLIVKGEIVYEKAGTTSQYTGIRASYFTRLYDLAIVAQEIVSQEARFCSFEQVGFSLIYPEYSIHKFLTGSSDKIYTITDKRTNERFRFAVRSCVIPPGF